MNEIRICCPNCNDSFKISISHTHSNEEDIPSANNSHYDPNPSESNSQNENSSFLKNNMIYRLVKNASNSNSSHQASANLRKISLNQTPRGLTNLGYISYVNSSIQCLSHIKTFRDRILDEEKYNDDKLIKALAILFEALNKNSNLVDEAQKVFMSYFSDIAVNQQGDVYEFILNLLNKLKSSMNKNHLISIFEAKKELTYTCSNCKQYINTIEPFLFLVLPSSHTFYSSSLSLQSLIDKMKEPYKSKWNCKKCLEYATVHVKTEFKTMPEILMVRLKSSKSVTTPVVYKPELVLKNSNKQVVYYNLISVISYIQNDGGFYTACVKLENEEWYYFNDSMVRKARQDKIYDPYNAFILFYKKSN